MHLKNYLAITSGLFSLIAILQLSRILFQWDVVIGGFPVPMWWSYILLGVPLIMAYIAVRLSRKAK